MKKTVITLLIIIAVSLVGVNSVRTARADELSDNIQDQLENIDLSQLEEYFENLNGTNYESVFEVINQMLKGQFGLQFSSLPEYLGQVFFNKINSFLPIFFSIIAIAILCGIINNLKGTFLSDGIADVIFFVCFSTIILLFSTEMIALWQEIQTVIYKISNLTEIMSPIILTLMTASGGTVSASIYKPAVVFLSSGVINIVLTIIIPLIGAMIIIGIVSNFSSSVKLKKFSDFFSSVIKWIIGIIVTIFGIFLSVQGISSATYDGISIKVAKYAISNSIPLIGGFLKDGFDIMVAGSVIIKNTIGVTVVIMLFYTVISPIITIIVFSLILKLCAAITEPISDVRISDFCTTMSKCTSYMITAVLCVGFMFFLTVLLMIFSANAFI